MKKRLTMAVKNKKGQITVEYMVLTLVVLSMLSISIAMLIQINNTAHQAVDNLTFRKSALDVQATIDEVCALGEGNSREIIVKTDMTVKKNNYAELIFKDKKSNQSLALNITCPESIYGSDINAGKVMISNTKNGIEIK